MYRQAGGRVEAQAEALAEEPLEEAAEVWAVDPVVVQRAGRAQGLAPECRAAAQVDRQG